MGVDLTIMPELYENSTSGMSFDVLKFEPNWSLFEAIEKLANKSGRQVPRGGIKCFMASTETKGWGAVEEDHYGQVILSVTAGELTDTILKFKGDRKDLDPKNFAILYFLKALPRGWVIYLFWH